MPLTLVGLGLTDEQDISFRGLQAVKEAEFVYLEGYTAVLLVSKEKLEAFYGRDVQELDRRAVEEGCEELLQRAKESEVAFLVVGDPLCATTHTDLMIRARKRGIEVKVIHNASIVSAAASSGMQLYRFGEVITIPFFDGSWQPDSFYHKIAKNKAAGLHTLCLFDIKVKEQTVENLMRGKQIFEPPKYMLVKDAIEQLLVIEGRCQQGACDEKVLAVGMARIGSTDQKLVAGSLADLCSIDFGGPMHSLVMCAPTLHDVEREFFDLLRIKED